MSGELSAFIRKNIIDEVPDAMGACLTCGAVRCPAEKYETCGYRLEFAEAMCRFRAAEDQKPSQPETSGRTAE